VEVVVVARGGKESSLPCCVLTTTLVVLVVVDIVFKLMEIRKKSRWCADLMNYLINILIITITSNINIRIIITTKYYLFTYY
jgi:predicted subunit of tRNA(5-methylaminomethyl-2-thiouridylate) methyltransferase